MTPQKKYLVIGVVLITVLVAMIVGARSFQKSAGTDEQGIATAKLKGARTAAIIIEEFSDFQCPSCAMGQPVLKKIEAEFPELVQVQYRHFPLEMHPFSREASKWAECAAEQRKFWPYHDLLFGEQSTWARDPDPKALFLAYANEIKLESDKLTACLAGAEALQRVEADKQLGIQKQISSTPTYFIGDERIVGSKQLDEKGPALVRKQLEALLPGKKK